MLPVICSPTSLTLSVFAMFSSTCHCRTFTFVLASISIYFQLLVTPIQALGINCRGSILCPDGRLKSPYLHSIAQIAKGMDCNSHSGFNCGPINNTDIWAPGKHIICLPQDILQGGICAFTQGNVAPLGTTGDMIRQKLLELKHHGCLVCGSVPLSDDNNPDTAGILTVNWVKNGVCWGLCPSTHYYNAQIPGNHTMSLNSNTIGAVLLPSLRSSIEAS